MVNDNLFQRGKPDGDLAMEKMFEQYKLAVEMWDRLRARRQHNNAFYVTLNSALLTVAISNEKFFSSNRYVAVAGFSLCVLWFFSILSYKTLTDDKWYVISRIESILPCSPFSAENTFLKDNNIIKKPRRFTIIERSVALLFAAMYIVIFVQTLS
ncbi:hypothetical protein HFO98_35945 [Rhizobium leguminosarum]|uniref:RipA family octameric membrane protein n=1 Tax=Rhizobium leguminosarum TaxID=384 RepID=UPI001C9839A5|nr:hypothetical protein [Rhizobium leguminosarum]MBY5413649.1 hypothetical protein [Rhizobium leguminosarum]